MAVLTLQKLRKLQIRALLLRELVVKYLPAYHWEQGISPDPLCQLQCIMVTVLFLYCFPEVTRWSKIFDGVLAIAFLFHKTVRRKKRVEGDPFQSKPTEILHNTDSSISLSKNQSTATLTCRGLGLCQHSQLVTMVL